MSSITLKLTDKTSEFFSKHSINKSAFIRKVIEKEIDKIESEVVETRDSTYSAKEVTKE